jgi:hypothetical protein
MARQTLTKITPKGPYPALPVAADSLDLTWTPAIVADKEQFIPSGNDLVLVRNTHATNAYTVTFTSTADVQGRTGDVTTYSIGAGEQIAFRFRKPGWKQSDGRIYMEASNTAIQYAVIQL